MFKANVIFTYYLELETCFKPDSNKNLLKISQTYLATKCLEELHVGPLRDLISSSSLVLHRDGR